MSKTRRIEFLQKLANLLQEYNAEIAVKYDPDSPSSDLNSRVLVIKVHNKKIYEDCYLSFDANSIKRYVENYLS